MRPKPKPEPTRRASDGQRNKLSNSDTAVAAKAKRIADHLRNLHSTGTEANLAAEQKVDPLTTDAYAETNDLNPHTLRRLKLFARTYSASELEDLCDTLRPNGLPLHWGYVPYLLTVKDETERRKLAKKAARQGWSQPRLQVEVRKLKNHVPGHAHGRSVTKPKNLLDGLRQIQLEGNVWLRRSGLVVKLVCESKSPKLTRNVQAAIAEVIKLMGSALDSCEGWVKKLECVHKAAAKLLKDAQLAKKKTR